MRKREPVVVGESEPGGAAQTAPLVVLIVEDEPVQAEAVAREVAALGWRALHAASLKRARETLASEGVDLIVLDRMLAGGVDGLDLLGWLRSDLEEDAPGVLVASRLTATEERVRGLDRGADDYLDKPFESTELRARLRALARRISHRRNPPSVLMLGDLEVRTANRVALWRGERIKLRPQSFDVLRTLAEARGEWVSREALWRTVWPDFAQVGPRDTVINTALYKLREVLAPVAPVLRIESAGRLGYRLVLAA